MALRVSLSTVSYQMETDRDMAKEAFAKMKRDIGMAIGEYERSITVGADMGNDPEVLALIAQAGQEGICKRAMTNSDREWTCDALQAILARLEATGAVECFVPKRKTGWGRGPAMRWRVAPAASLPVGYMDPDAGWVGIGSPDPHGHIPGEP